MTAATGAINFGMVYPGGWRPAEGGVARFTTICRIDVITVFARGSTAIMTA